MRALLDRLPDAVTLEDIQYHLDVVVKVLEAEASDPSNDIPHEELVQVLRGKMAYRVVWSVTARADLDEIEAYLAARSSPVDARRVSLERMWQTAAQVHGFPLLGPHDS